MLKHKINRTVPFLILAFLFLCSDAVAKPVRITSYRKNFVVTAPDHRTASGIAADSESLREDFLKKMGWKQVWKNPVEFTISKEVKRVIAELDYKDDAYIFRVLVPERGDYFHNFIFSEIIKFSVINHSEIRTDGFLENIYGHVPYWMLKGLVVRMDPRTEFIYANAATGNIFSGKFFQVPDLFEIRGSVGKEELDKAAGYEAASLIDYLLHLEKGKERFKTLVSSLNAGEGWKCVFEDIYYSDFKTEEELNSRFLRSLSNPNKISFNLPRMDYAASLELLNNSLAVRVSSREIPAEESRYVSDLKSLKKCCLEETARRKLMQAYPALIKLKFEGNEKLQGVVEKYLNAYIINGSDRKKFWKGFIEAENERKKINNTGN